jgi:hypothetical protein
MRGQSVDAVIGRQALHEGGEQLGLSGGGRLKRRELLEHHPRVTIRNDTSEVMPFELDEALVARSSSNAIRNSQFAIRNSQFAIRQFGIAR